MIHTILFDLDDTLYPRSAGIMVEIRRLILDFVQTRLSLPAGEADVLRHEYLLAYGTTMRGLQVNHEIDAEEYLRHVHDIPLHRYLQPNPELDAAMASIPQDKVVFTNASREHAERVLAVLGIRRHFARIVDIRDMAFKSKPEPSAYRRICELLRVRPEECVLVEDNVRNLCPAKELGMGTVLVGETSQSAHDCVDQAIEHIEEIGEALVELGRDAAPEEH